MTKATVFISIPKWYDWSIAELNEFGSSELFQFLNGTIGVRQRCERSYRPRNISIPKWYDWSGK